MCDINRFLSTEHMCDDRIHLNAKGYRVFMDQGVGILLGNYYKNHRKPKCDRNPVASKSRSSRKRMYKARRVHQSKLR